MRAAGFEPEDYADDEPFEVWPENWSAVDLFCRMSTQWRTTFAGMIGLDYGVLFRLLDRRYGDDADAWDQAFDDVGVMETATLQEMRKAK